MSNTPPVVALVHGAFAESASWNPVLDRLHGLGVDAVAVANPLRGLSSDASYVRDVVASLGRPAILVGHSYGGMVITEAGSDNPNVLGLVYVSAFAPDTGESALQLSSSFPGSTLGEALNAYPVTAGGNEFAIGLDVFPHQFAADVPIDVATKMGRTQRPVAESALTEGLPTQSPAWVQVPSWFVFGEEDRNIPCAAMRAEAVRAGAKDIQQVPGASHAISVSRPDVVADSILKAVATASGASAA